MQLDVLADEIFVRTNEWSGTLAGLVSEEREEPIPHPGGVPARPLPPRVRPARRLVQHRRERLRGQHLLGAALPGRRDRAGREGLPAARHAAGGRGLRDLRPDHDAGPHARPRHPRLHARPQHGRVHPHAPRHEDPGRHARVRDQRLERALLGAAGAPLRGRVRAGQVGAARRRLQHALDRLDGGRGASHPRARRPLHVPARHQGPVQARAPAPHVRGEPDGDDHRAGGRRRLHGPGPHPRGGAHLAAPARPGDPRARARRSSASSRYHRDHDAGVEPPTAPPLFHERSLFTKA